MIRSKSARLLEVVIYVTVCSYLDLSLILLLAVVHGRWLLQPDDDVATVSGHLAHRGQVLTLSTRVCGQREFDRVLR